MKVYLYCKKRIKKWTQYGHAKLGHFLGQKPIYFRTTAFITNIAYACIEYYFSYGISYNDSRYYIFNRINLHNPLKMCKEN